MILSSAYLPPVQWFSHLKAAAGQTVYVERNEHYQKQTWRNRCCIATEGGVQALTVPVVAAQTADGKQLMRDVRISSHGDWRHVHWNALTAAYRHTPYFTYYADLFQPYYQKPADGVEPLLFDYNLQLTQLCCSLMGLTVTLTPTDDYSPAADDDFRTVISPKVDYTAGDPTFTPRPYYQVFADRHGFLPNLSVADLLFNMGPESIFYL